MTDGPSSHTVADVFHNMYLASDGKAGFSRTLAELLEMDIANLRTLYDQPAPDPDGPDFDDTVAAIASGVGADPGTLAHLLRRWPGEEGQPRI